MRHLTLAISVFLAACGGWALPGHSVRNHFPTFHQPEVVRAAILRASERIHWSVEDEEPGALFLGHQSGGAYLRVAVVYDRQHYEINYITSEGFERPPDAGPGDERISANYMRWMNRLDRIIRRSLSSAADEHREMERERREMELRVAQARAREAEASYLAQQPAPQPAPTQQAPAQTSGASAPAAPALRGGFQVTREPNGLGAAVIRIMNRSANPLRAVYTRRRGSRDWGPNQLGYRTLEPGGTFSLSGVSPGTWELRIENLQAYKEWGPLRFGAGGEYTVVVTTQGWYRQ